MSNSAYLEKEIGGVLAEGLAEVVRAQPADPVRHLGKWLQKYVENENLKAQIDAQLKIRSAEVEVLLENERKQKEIEAQRAKAIEDEINRYQSFLSTLKDAKPNSCEEFLHAVVEALPAYVGASDAYAAELAEETRLRYVSATANNKFLVDQSLIRFDPEQNPAGRPNITFQLFQQPEESEEAPAEEFEPEDESPEAVAYREKKAAEAQKKALEVRTVHVPDTLIGPGSEKIHFFRLPQLGAYLCARIYYSSALSEEAIQQAAERDTPPAVEAKEDKKKGDDDEDGGNDEEEEEEEASSKKKKKGKKAKKDEEEEEEEAAPEEELSEEEKEERKKQAEEAERKKREWEALTDEQKAERKAQEEMDRLLKDIPLKTAQYALCLDTLGQNRAFTPQQIERVQEIVRIAQKVLERLDRQLFKVQVEKRIQLLIAPRSVPSAKEEKKVRKEMATKVGKKDTAAPEAQFAYRQYLIGTVKSALSDWCNHLFFRGSLPVLQAAMMLVGYPKDSLMDPATKQLDWKRVRSFLTAEFVDKVEQYNARLEEVQEAGPEAAKYAAIQEIISGTSYDELKEQNYPLAELFGFVTDALAVKAVAKEEREAAEEEARKKKEEEEEEEKAKADKEKEDDGDKEKEEEEDE